MARIMIPVEEFKERVARAAKLVAEKGLDVLVVNGSEADYADTRYFSNFWPLFERCGVAIAANGEAALMVGPESQIFAGDFSWMDRICVVYQYRESANPAYPELKSETFRDVFHKLGVTGENIKIGVAAKLNTNVVQFDGIRECYPKAEIVWADDIMLALRRIKSDNEIACIREAARITDLATKAVMAELKPGKTELELVGVAQKCIYENGAEYAASSQDVAGQVGIIIQIGNKVAFILVLPKRGTKIRGIGFRQERHFKRQRSHCPERFKTWKAYSHKETAI